MKKFLYEFIVFGLKQAQACVFAASFFLLLFLSNIIPLFGIPRYDFLFLSAFLLQIVLVKTKIETYDELKVICIFHIIGLVLEIFKTHPSIGSWSYPEEGWFKILGVPLYSGFMYAAVASYICQAWRIFSLRIERYPSYILSIPLCAGIYFNFFTHHFIPDFRYIFIVFVFFIFRKTQVYFTVLKEERSMPLTLSFILIGFFIWVAENISTFFGAWEYPNQELGWDLVSTSKITSWGLLVIISIIIVADLKHLKEGREHH